MPGFLLVRQAWRAVREHRLAEMVSGRWLGGESPLRALV